MKKGQLPTNLPVHAVAEIEANPAQLGWWLRWSAVGEARDAMGDATRRLSLFESDWRECVELAGGRRPADPCACGTCPTVYVGLRDDVAAAKAAVDAAVAAFKES